MAASRGHMTQPSGGSNIRSLATFAAQERVRFLRPPVPPAGNRARGRLGPAGRMGRFGGGAATATDNTKLLFLLLSSELADVPVPRLRTSARGGPCPLRFARGPPAPGRPPPMGIPGLTRYVEEHGEFFTALRLHDARLVIDGSSLYHRLWLEGGLDAARGGDYEALAGAARGFFAALRACCLRAHVVLDGGREPGEAKLATRRQRARQRLEAAAALGRGARGAALPLLARDAFRQVLAGAGVPFVQCLGEADRDAAALARRWGCPLLGSDSDFCTFRLPAGYCPLGHFQWRDIAGDSPERYIPARCFSADKLCAHFGRLDQALLPLFALLSGNDHGRLPALDTFLCKARLPTRSCCRRRGARKHGQICGLLSWLAGFANPAEAVDSVVRHLPEHEREQVRELLHASLDQYERADGNLEDYFESGSYESQVGRELELPHWMLRALARGDLSPFMTDALILRRTFLHVQVENMQRPSAHTVALPIRQVIYGLLLNAGQDSETCGEAKLPAQLPVVQEFDRFQKTLKKTFVQIAVLPVSFCSDHLPLDKLTEVPMSDRLKLLLETLGVKFSILEPIPSHLQLPLAVTCYWTRYSEPILKLHHLKALLLGIVFGELQRTTSSPGPEVFHVQDNKVAYDHFLKWKEKKLQNTDLDLDTAHTFCQWQCCLQMGLYLNQLLSSPLPEPDLTRLYSGTVVHRLCHELKSSPSAESLLSLSPKIGKLYFDLLHTVKSAVPSDFFQKTKSKSCKEKKKATNQEETTSECVTMEIQPLHDLNRFALLEVED